MKNAIKNLEIKNFKSIKDLKIKTKRINLFIGKPNVGKSNILEALSMFGWNYKKHDAPIFDDYIRFKKTIELFHNKNSKNDIEVKINYAYLTLRSKFHNIFDFVISINKNLSLLLPTRFQAGDNYKLFEDFVHKNKRLIETWPIPPCLKILQSDKQKDTDMEIPRLITPIKKYSFKNIERTNTYDIMLLPPYGDNLGIILRNNPKLRERFAELINREYGWKLTIEEPDFNIKLLKLDGSSIITTDFDLIADTLQRIIFYHAAIATNKDSVLIFEEPEVHSFPTYITMLADTIINDKNNQYFISTHNQYFLMEILGKTNFTDVALHYVDYKNYETRVTTIEKNKISEILDYGLDVFLNWKKFSPDGK